ncbi:MAG TPA: hypothetical protein VMX77_01440 [Candidatus Bathyarchaeia archaeon]|nr:hypothetical protein [Candidatus Bathyarchaeia archaeon]
MSPIHEIFLPGLDEEEARRYLGNLGYDLTIETVEVKVLKGPKGKIDWVEIYPAQRPGKGGAVVCTSSNQLVAQAERQAVQPVVKKNLRQP